jgi:VCBS repeat-containing protein
VNAKFDGSSAMVKGGQAAKALLGTSAIALHQGQVAPAKVAKAVFVKRPEEEEVFGDRQDVADTQETEGVVQISMVGESAAGGAVDQIEMVQAQEGGGGSAAPAAGGESGGGIGTLPLVLGGIALVGGGVALAAGGGGRSNSAPTASASQAVTTAEDTKATITVTATDPDGDTLTFTNTNPTKGTVTASGGSFTYTPNADFNGTDSFTVTASDGRGGSVTQTINITVSPVNDVPVAKADTAVATEDAAAVTGSVATNDSDVDGDTLSYALAAPVAGLTLNANGGFSFDAGNAAYQDLAAGQTRAVVANYTVADGKGGTAASALTITVTGVNDAPVAQAGKASVAEDATVAGKVVATDVDQGAVLSYSLDAPVTGLVFNKDGTFSFDASGAAYQDLAAGQTRDVVANYTVTDDKGATSKSTLTITVTGANDAPLAQDAKFSVSEDANLAGKLVATDADQGAVLSYALNTAVAGLVVNKDGSASFDASNAAYQNLAAGETRTLTTSYTVTDDKGATATAPITITVTGVNDAPVAKNLALTLAEDTKQSGSIVATDVDNGATLTYALTTPVAGLSIAANGGFTFDAANAAYQNLAQGKSRDVVATYSVTDDKGAATAATFTFTVTGANDAPVAVSATNKVNEDSQVTGQLIATDVDDGAVLSFALDAPVAGLTLNKDGSYALDASNAAYQSIAQGEVRNVVANVTVTDNFGASSKASLTIAVTGLNDAPVAQAGTNAVAEDASVTGQLVATDVDTGAVLSYALDAPVAGLTINKDGSYTLDASNAAYQSLAAGATKVVVASYTVTDDKGAKDTDTLTITVTGVNDAPVAQAATNKAAEDASVTGQLIATDVDTGAVLTYTLDAPVAGLTINKDGSYTFNAGNAAYQSLAAGETKNVVASYTVKDDQGATDTETLTITVTGVNDAPVAKAGAFAVTEDAAVVTGKLVATDVDNNDVLTFALDAPVAGLVVNADGSWTFNPGDAAYQSLAEGEVAEVVASYTVTDKLGETSSATVTITLTGKNDLPVIVSAATGTLDENLPASTVVYTAKATDVDNGTSLTYSLAGGDAALFSIDAKSGEVRLNASANFEAKQAYSFTVIASDGLASVQQAVALGVNDLVDSLTISGGDALQQVIVDASGTEADVLDVNYGFIEQLADENDVRLTNFGPNDFIEFDSELGQYNFVNTDGDLVITQAVGGVVSRIVIDQVLDPGLVLVNNPVAANAALNAALGTTGVNYLVGPNNPEQPVSADQGNGALVVLDAADGAFAFNENVGTQNTVEILNFTADDRIVVAGAAPGSFSFVVDNLAGGAAQDLIITFNNSGVVNSITLVDFFSTPPGPEVLFADPSVIENAIEAFVGYDFFQYA